MPPIASNNDNSGEPTLEQKYAALEQEATKLRQASTAASNLLSDPAVRSVLEAKQAGVDISVISKADLEKLHSKSKQEHVEEPPMDLNEVTDNEVLAAQIMKRMSSAFDSALTQKLDPLLRKVTAVEQYATQNVAKDMDNQITQLRAKYQDFKDFESDMLDISKQSPNLSIEELYTLAKHRKGSPITPLSGLSSERPVTDATTRSIRSISSEKTPKGRQGFEELLRSTQR